MADDKPGLPYHLIHRGGRSGPWRPILGVFVLIVSFVVLVPVLVQVPFAVGLAAAGRDVGEGLDRLLDFDDPTPLGLAYLNIGQPAEAIKVFNAAAPRADADATWKADVHRLAAHWRDAAATRSAAAAASPLVMVVDDSATVRNPRITACAAVLCDCSRSCLMSCVAIGYHTGDA